MPYADELRELFPGLELEVRDLFALEAHQVAELPRRVPERPLAELLHAHPDVRTFLEVRYPPIGEHLARLLTDHAPAAASELARSEQAVLWEIGDLLVYDTAPERYDALPLHAWDFEAVTELVDLDGKVVIDAGAGTGKVAFEAITRASVVFAVEPVARLRRYMREKAAAADIDGLFVLDGTLDAIPLPNDAADVLLTCRAIGWRLEAELVEAERVVRDGGVVLHLGLPHTPPETDPLGHRLIEDGYVAGSYPEGPVERRCYRKTLATA